jgi:hypothetical protein
METFIFSEATAERMHDYIEDIKKFPQLKADFTWYDMSREE